METTERNIPKHLLLEIEMEVHGIVSQDDGSYLLDAAGEQVSVCSLEECLTICENELDGLKGQVWKEWCMLGHLAEGIVGEPKYNESSCLDNILLLSTVRKSYLLSLLFDELKDITKAIKSVYKADIAHVDECFVRQFNETYMNVKTLHMLILKEMYRCMLIKQFMKMRPKMASISGPWSQLDLPQQERVWEWYAGGDEEYFRQRTKAKQQQTRYRPENNLFGFYYVFPEEASRRPYRFGTKTDSPYKSRYISSIASTK